MLSLEFDEILKLLPSNLVKVVLRFCSSRKKIKYLISEKVELKNEVAFNSVNLMLPKVIFSIGKSVDF